MKKRYFQLKKLNLNIFYFFLLMWVTLKVEASALGIQPLRLFLKQDQKTGVFIINNPQNESTLFELKIFKWSQKNGKDILQPAADMIVNPPIVKLNSNQSQILRVGFRKVWQPLNEEASYRLILSQIPMGSDKKIMGVKTLLRISLPIFVTPAVKAPAYNFQLKKQGKYLSVKMINRGNMHVLVSELRLYANGKKIADQKAFNYLLPRQSKIWHFDLSKIQSIKPSSLVVKTDSDPIVFDIKS